MLTIEPQCPASPCWYVPYACYDDDACALFPYQVYDHSLTMGLEMSLVWPSPWSLGKVLYFLTAYLPFADSGMLLFMNRLFSLQTLIVRLD
jgi:Family of unknown function (DUF6533)